MLGAGNLALRSCRGVADVYQHAPSCCCHADQGAVFPSNESNGPAGAWKRVPACDTPGARRVARRARKGGERPEPRRRAGRGPAGA